MEPTRQLSAPRCDKLEVSETITSQNDSKSDSQFAFLLAVNQRKITAGSRQTPAENTKCPAKVQQGFIAS